MTKNEDVFSCPTTATLEIIAGRWKPDILWHLQDGAVRFNELRRKIGGVSQKMLTQQLRELQRDGMVARTQYEEIPPRVEYTLTELAGSLGPLLGSIANWSDDNGAAVHKARQKYDRKRK